MNDMLDGDLSHALKMIGPSGRSDEDPQRSAYRLSSSISPEPGKRISGEDLYNIFQAAKAEGVTATSKLGELTDATVETIISPGPGVVRQATRSGRKRRGDRELLAQDRAWRELQKRAR